MTPKQVIDDEIKRFSDVMNVSTDQKEDLIHFLRDNYAQLLNFMRRNPGVSRNDLFQRLDIIRSAGQAELAEFLSPEQLTIWDSEMAKASKVLSQKLAA